MKRGQFDGDLVEIMACPSGCNNGGGQLKNLSYLESLEESLENDGNVTSSSTSAASSITSSISPSLTETIQQSKERIANVENLFHRSLKFAHPDESPLVQYLYNERRLVSPLSNHAIQILHTRLHAVPKLETIVPLASKW
jgi:hypothetical protein